MTRQIRVRGRVQGVGFRYAVQAEAKRLGVAGWVRNRADGSVEILAQAGEESLQRLMDWARGGPPGARVDRIEEVAPPETLPQGYARFEIRPTA